MNQPNSIIDNGESRKISFGDTSPEGYETIPEIGIDDLRWQSGLNKENIDTLFIEHQLGHRSAHQVRDFLVACYNVLAPGGVLRVAEADFANPSSAYQALVNGHNQQVRLDFARLASFLNGAGFLVRGAEFHDSFNDFHIDRAGLRDRGIPARSRLKDSRGTNPSIMYSSLVVDAFKVGSSLSPAYAGLQSKFIAVGDSHTRFLAGKDDTNDGENIPHARQYKGFAAHFDALHLGPGLAYNLDRTSTTTRIFERVNTLVDTGVIPQDRTIVFSFGEIDCRSHVVRQTERQGATIEAVVSDICAHYANFLKIMLGRNIRPAVWGPVASTPNQNYGDPDAPAYGTIEQRNHGIATFNAMMRDVCGRLEIPFLSVAAQLAGDDGRTKSEFYCDDIHLSQRARRLLWALMPSGEMIPPARPPVISLRAATQEPAGKELREVTVFKRNGGWTWFQDERVIVLGEQLLIGSAAGKTRADSEAGDIDLTIFDVGTKTSKVVKLHERFQPDDHDAPSLLVLPDGRLLCGYQSHPADGMQGQNLMRWRVSTCAGDPTKWCEERTIDVGGRVSYCHLVRMPGENERIYSFFRGPDSRPHYLISDDGGETFVHAGKLLSWDFDHNSPLYSGRDGYRPYVKYIAGDDETIHLIASEDHPRAWPNSIYHARLRNGRILHSDGRDIGPMGSGTDAPIRVDQLTCVFQGDEDNIAWPMDVHVDENGHPFLLFSVRKGDRENRRKPGCGGADHRYGYARWDGTRWNVVELCHSGSALYQDEEDFSGLATLDPNDPDVVFVSTNVDPVTGAPLINRQDGKHHFEIYRGSSPDRGATWLWTALTAQSESDNIRSVVPIWLGKRRAVLWMQGTYTTYTNYDTDIVGFVEHR